MIGKGKYLLYGRYHVSHGIIPFKLTVAIGSAQQGARPSWFVSSFTITIVYTIYTSIKHNGEDQRGW
jgi:hypothetical protein